MHIQRVPLFVVSQGNHTSGALRWQRVKHTGIAQLV
jgi:hypothetical protein